MIYSISIDFFQLKTEIPCTYTTQESYILVPGVASSGGIVRASFQFRTHDEDGLLLYHQMNDPSEVRVSKNKTGYHSEVVQLFDWLLFFS